MLDNNTLDEMRRLIYIGQNKIYQHQERLDALFAFEKIYVKLSREEKKTCEMLLYLSYRERAALYFTTNINSKECNTYFEKSFQIVNNGDYDSDINVCISKSMYCKSLILSGLSEKRILDIDKARKCFEEIEAKLRIFGRPDVLESINEIKEIFNQIDAKNIWTVVNFEIPYYINLPDSTEYEYIYQGVKCKVKSITIESPRRKGYICKNAYLFNKQDKYGLLNYSRRVFISFRYSDGIKYKKKLSDLFDEETKIINCSEDEDRSNMSDETIRKELLERYLYEDESKEEYAERLKRE